MFPMLPVAYNYSVQRWVNLLMGTSPTYNIMPFVESRG